MRFKAKWIMIIAGGIIALLLLAVVLASTLIRPQYLANLVASEIQSRTGRALDFGGEVSLSFFPWLGVEASNLTLGNAKEFGPEPMVKISSVQVRVKVLPLLEGAVEADHIILDGVDLHLSRNKRGLTNWDDLANTGTTAKAKNKPDKANNFQAQKGATAQTVLTVQNLTLHGVNLSWDDRKSGSKYQLRDGSLELDNFRLDKPFGFKLEFSFDSDKPEFTGSVKLAANARFDLERELYSLINVSSEIKAQGEALPESALDAQLQVQSFMADFKSQSLKAEKLVLSAYDVSAKGDLSVSGLNKTPSIRGTLDFAEFDGRRLMETLGVGPIQTAATTALGSVAGDFQFVYDSYTLNVPKFNLSLDGSALEGSLGIRNFPNPAYSFDVVVDQLNVDRYLAPESSGHGEDESSQAAPSSSSSANGTVDSAKNNPEQLIPVDLLRKLDIRGKLAVDRLTVKHMKFNGVNVQVVAENGRISVDPAFLNGYGGSVDTVLVVDVVGNQPRTDLVTEVKQVQLGDLLKDYNGDESLQGTTSLYTALGCNGDTVSTMLKTLGGKLTFKLEDGVFPGVDVLGLAKTTQAAKSKSGPIEADDDDKTKFGMISGSAKIKKGEVSNQDLKLMAPNLRGIGKGTINLVSTEISYLVHVKLVASAKGQGGSSYDDTLGIPVPIHVGGTLQDPSYFVNPAEYILMLGNGVVDTVGGVVKGVGGVAKGVGEGVGGLLKSLIPSQKKEPAK